MAIGMAKSVPEVLQTPENHQEAPREGGEMVIEIKDKGVITTGEAIVVEAELEEEVQETEKVDIEDMNHEEEKEDVKEEVENTRKGPIDLIRLDQDPQDHPGTRVEKDQETQKDIEEGMIREEVEILRQQPVKKWHRIQTMRMK